MASYKQLLEQRAALEKQIADARQTELSEAVSQVRALIAEYELTAEDVFPAARTGRATKGSTVAAKYRDPATGQTWTGRGKAPKWIAEQDREKFLIA